MHPASEPHRGRRVRPIRIILQRRVNNDTRRCFTSNRAVHAHAAQPVGRWAAAAPSAGGRVACCSPRRRRAPPPPRERHQHAESLGTSARGQHASHSLFSAQNSLPRVVKSKSAHQHRQQFITDRSPTQLEQVTARAARTLSGSWAPQLQKLEWIPEWFLSRSRYVNVAQPDTTSRVAATSVRQLDPQLTIKQTWRTWPWNCKAQRASG